jgi:hypothetical protein
MSIYQLGMLLSVVQGVLCVFGVIVCVIALRECKSE